MIAISTLLGVVLFSESAQALQLYQSNFNASSASKCGIGNGEDCSTDNGLTRDDYVWQEVLIQPSSTDERITIDQVKLKWCDGDADTTPTATWKAFLIPNDEQFALGRIDNDWSAHASSTSNELNGMPTVACDPTTSSNTYEDAEFNWPGSGYSITATSTVSHIVFKATYGGMGPIVGPVFKTVIPSYPPASFSAFQFLWNGGSNTINGNLAENGDLAIEIYRSETQLTIDYPAHNQTYESVSSFEGECTDDVNYGICNVTVAGEEIWCAYDSTVCGIGDNWISTSYNLTDEGYYLLEATSTAGMQDLAFFTIQEDFATSTSPFTGNPFSGEEGGDMGFWGYLWGWAKKAFSEARPWSYVPEIYNAIRTANLSASSTSPFPEVTLVSPNGGSTTTITLAQIDAEQVYTLVPESAWNTLRPVMEGVIYLVFALFVWRKVKQLL